MTIRTSLISAAVLAIALAGVTQPSSSSPVKARAAGQFQGIGVIAAASSQGVDKVQLDRLETCLVATRKTGPTKMGQVKCGTAGLYDPKVSCCCSPVKNTYKIVPKSNNPNCNAPCRNAGKRGANK